MADLSERVSVIEVKIENMEEALQRLSRVQEEHQNITLQIKERLDKQNGIIPHMAEDIRNMSVRQEELIKGANEHAVSTAASKVKMGIMWALVSAFGMGVLGYILKGFLE